MIDLLGFWTAATLMVAPFFLTVYYFLEKFINHEVKVVSDYRASWSPLGNYWDKLWNNAYRKDNEVFLGLGYFVAIIFSMVCLGIPLGMVDCDTGVHIPYLQGVSEIALFFTPICNYIAVPLIVLAGYRAAIRPMLIKAFKLKVKIDNL